MFMQLIECGIKCNKLDLEELCEHLLGTRGYYFALLVMFIFAYGAMIAYLVIIGDTIPLVAEHSISPDSIIADRTLVMGVLAVVIILPLCLLKDLSTLAWTSAVGVLGDFILVIIAIAAAPNVAKAEGHQFDSSHVSFVSSSVFAGIGTMSFAFVCQVNSWCICPLITMVTSSHLSAVYT
jgi:solute carrier family 38 (sodium-coupled neutral amino acid transporter), member 11